MADPAVFNGPAKGWLTALHKHVLYEVRTKSKHTQLNNLRHSKSIRFCSAHEHFKDYVLVVAPNESSQVANAKTIHTHTEIQLLICLFCSRGQTSMSSKITFSDWPKV